MEQLYNRLHNSNRLHVLIVLLMASAAVFELVQVIPQIPRLIGRFPAGANSLRRGEGGGPWTCGEVVDPVVSNPSDDENLFVPLSNPEDASWFFYRPGRRPPHPLVCREKLSGVSLFIEASDPYIPSQPPGAKKEDGKLAIRFTDQLKSGLSILPVETDLIDYNCPSFTESMTTFPDPEYGPIGVCQFIVGYVGKRDLPVTLELTCWDGEVVVTGWGPTVGAPVKTRITCLQKKQELLIQCTFPVFWRGPDAEGPGKYSFEYVGCADPGKFSVSQKGLKLACNVTLQQGLSSSHDNNNNKRRPALGLLHCPTAELGPELNVTYVEGDGKVHALT